MGEATRAESKVSEVKKENVASQKQNIDPCQSISSPTERILFLQRTIGNRAVQRLLKSGALQAKLRIGAPGDIYEQEADRVAEQVMRMPEPEAVSGNIPDNPVQRACPKCTDRRLPEEEALQSKEVPGLTSEITPDLEADINSIRGDGQPLPESVRTFYEPRFGYDFSGVRVHTDAKAAEAARAVNARAFTVGRDVVFGEGEYAPGTSLGRRLMAHELTHVVQQASSLNTNSRATTVGRSDTSCEREASIIADVIVQKRDVIQITSSAVTPNIQYQPVGAPAQVTQKTAESQFTEEELAEAGLLALGQTLQSIAAPETETLRNMYNQGAARIEAERVRLQAAKVAESEIAQRLSQMRHELAMNVRKAGSALLRKGAEAFDQIRGNIARPTYESLRAAGKTDAQIIRSASRTNAFINRLPKGLRWAGRGMWFIQAGISIYVILEAPPEARGQVAQKEVEGIIGGIGGAAIFEGVCFVTGLATEGLGLIVCGLIGGAVGFETARRGNLLEILDIAPHQVPALAGHFYRIQGDWDVSDFFIFSIVHRTVAASEHILVVATGQRSGEMVSGRGHYRGLEVIPANEAAVQLFGSRDAKFVPEYLLYPASQEDFLYRPE